MFFLSKVYFVLGTQVHYKLIILKLFNEHYNKILNFY